MTLVSVSPAEEARRRKISESARSSQARAVYYDRIRGVPKGPDALTTRASKSASHRVPKGTRAWAILYEFALKRLLLEEEAAARLKEEAA